MKSKVRTIAIIIISILLLILIAVIIYNVVYLPTTKEDIQQTNEDNSDDNISVKHIFLDDNTKQLEICNDDVDCGFGIRTYHTISTDITDENLLNAINSIDEKINNSYTVSLNATDMTSAECSNVSNLYQRSIMTQSILTLYGSDDLLGIALISGESNLCLFTNNEEIDVLYYDINNKKLLTEDEMKTKYSITDEEILTAVTNDINERNIEENLNYTTNILDYHIYITSDGMLSVYYKQPEDNIYYSVPLDIAV